MVSNKVTTVAGYLASLPADRRAAIEQVRKVILKNLPRGYEEGIQYGMIGYCIPLSRYPNTYNGQPLAVASLASQKSHLAIYLVSVYSDPELQAWFEDAYRKSGKKLDMGKSCLRFKKVEDVALDVVGEAISRFGVERYIAVYEKARAGTAAGKKKAARAKAAPKKTASKKAAPKQAAAKKPAAKKPAAKKKPVRA